jgi:hypothetical protein
MYLSTAAGTPQDVGYTGMVCHTVTRADGDVEDLGCNHNILILTGKNTTTSQLFNKPSAADATNGVVDNMTLGNGTAVPHQLESVADFGGIPDCGLNPTTGQAWINVNNGTGTYVDGSGNVSTNNKWTATCGSGTGERVNQTLLSTHATPAVMFAANTFTDVYLQSGDQLNVTWYVWIT